MAYRKKAARSAVGPFIKWAGGKRSLLPQLQPLLPKAEAVQHYVQPFVGAGSPYWQLYSNVLSVDLSDKNPQLYCVYTAVRDETEALIEALHRAETDGYCADAYAAALARLNSGAGDLVYRAAAFVVVNRWGFNGLWRVNKKGLCNVPFGKTATGRPPKLVDEDRLRACAEVLQGVRVELGDFDATVTRAGRGSFVYLDPPYAPVSDTSSFTGYTSGGFSYAVGGDHDRLLACLEDLDRRGVSWALSQADVPAVRAEYVRRGWELHAVRARRSINSNGGKRGPVDELLVLGQVRL